MVGVLRNEDFRPVTVFGKSDDGLAKTRGIERLTPAIVAILVQWIEWLVIVNGGNMIWGMEYMIWERYII